jgi:hypothetical protein
VTAERAEPGRKGEPGGTRSSRGDVPAAVLRPGIALPTMGYLGAIGFLITAVIVTVLAHAGGNHAPMPRAGDWRAIGDRLIAGGDYRAGRLDFL